MTAFDEAVADLVADDDLGIAATHWPGGLAAGATVRLVLTSDRPELGIGIGRAAVERLIGQVRSAQLPALAAGDFLNAGGVWYRIEPNPERDAAGLWRLGLRREPPPGALP